MLSTKAIILDETGKAIAEAIRNIPGPTDDQVNTWLSNHPEATTSIADGAITEAKLSSTLNAKKGNWYASKTTMLADAANLAAGMTCCTKGLNEPNDGGGAVYHIRNKRTSETADGSSSISLTDDLIAERIYQDTIVSSTTDAPSTDVISFVGQKYINTEHIYIAAKNTAGNFVWVTIGTIA